MPKPSKKKAVSSSDSDSGPEDVSLFLFTNEW